MSPGLVNRVYDYIQYNGLGNRVEEGTWFESVTVSGNRAYAIMGASPFGTPGQPSDTALEVYDVSNPDQPVWVGAVEAAVDPPDQLFVNGNNLWDIGYSRIALYNLQGSLPVFMGVSPLAVPYVDWVTVNGSVAYVLPSLEPGFTIPVDVYDMSSGSVAHNHYELPFPSDDAPLTIENVTGVGNTLYASWVNQPGATLSFTIATYDLSTSPPTLVNSFLTSNGVHLQIANQLLFADYDIYDISNVVPQLIASLPVSAVVSVQGDKVLAVGSLGQHTWAADYVVVDISNPTNPVITANVVDLPSWDIFAGSTATFANNGRIYSTDGPGGIAVYNVNNPGGWSSATQTGVLRWIYDEALSQQTLYSVGTYSNADAALEVFDVSGSAPNLLGTLVYSNDTPFAVRASGTNVFLGLADSLKVIDASNPSNPVETASVSIPTNALAISGTTLFAGTSDGHLVVLDVSNPTAPKTIATVAMPAPENMRLLGTLLYVAAGPAGMLIFDVSNPRFPRCFRSSP